MVFNSSLFSLLQDVVMPETDNARMALTKVLLIFFILLSFFVNTTIENGLLFLSEGQLYAKRKTA